MALIPGTRHVNIYFSENFTDIQHNKNSQPLRNTQCYCCAYMIASFDNILGRVNTVQIFLNANFNIILPYTPSPNVFFQPVILMGLTSLFIISCMVIYKFVLN